MMTTTTTLMRKIVMTIMMMFMMHVCCDPRFEFWMRRMARTFNCNGVKSQMPNAYFCTTGTAVLRPQRRASSKIVWFCHGCLAACEQFPTEDWFYCFYELSRSPSFPRQEFTRTPNKPPRGSLNERITQESGPLFYLPDEHDGNKSA